MSAKKTNRLIHKWASIIIAIPLLVVFVTGILLLVKKEFDVLQPPTMKGHNSGVSIPFEQVLDIAKTVESAQVLSWQDIDRLDVRPNKGIIKIRANNRIEIQIDGHSGEVLHVAKRNSDLIESIHDGTFFQKYANLWLMLPVAIIAVLVSITGIILFVLYYTKRSVRKVGKHTVNTQIK